MLANFSCASVLLQIKLSCKTHLVVYNYFFVPIILISFNIAPCKQTLDLRGNHVWIFKMNEWMDE